MLTSQSVFLVCQTSSKLKTVVTCARKENKYQKEVLLFIRGQLTNQNVGIKKLISSVLFPLILPCVF